MKNDLTPEDRNNMTSISHKPMKQSYQELVKCIQAIVNEWDPYDLIRGGAPDDEFSEEIAQIAAKASKVKSPTEMAEVVSSVFSKEFAAEQHFSIDACMPVATRIFSEIQALGGIDKNKV